MDNEEVADVLSEIAILLELKGENPFKTRAYVNAARTLENLDASLEALIANEQLDDIKGIGTALRQKITELVTTGKLEYYDDLKASLPPGLLDMMDIPGLGPKKVRAVYDKLGIESVDALEAACQDDRVAGLSGFGKKTQEKILKGIAFRRTYASKHRVGDALNAAHPILAKLENHPDVQRCPTAGSLPRPQEPPRPSPAPRGLRR